MYQSLSWRACFDDCELGRLVGTVLGSVSGVPLQGPFAHVWLAAGRWVGGAASTRIVMPQKGFIAALVGRSDRACLAESSSDTRWVRVECSWVSVWWQWVGGRRSRAWRMAVRRQIRVAGPLESWPEHFKAGGRVSAIQADPAARFAATAQESYDPSYPPCLSFALSCSSGH